MSMLRPKEGTWFTKTDTSNRNTDQTQTQDLFIYFISNLDSFTMLQLLKVARCKSQRREEPN